MEKAIKEKREGILMQALVSDRQIATEIASDFSIPDYQPEIKRILRVTATVLPADRYVGVGSAEFSGALRYNILYVGNDGALYCTVQSDSYQLSVPLELSAEFDLGEGFVCDVESVADMAVGRLIAPRKFSVKCRLRSHVRVFGTKYRETSLIGAAPAALQRLCGRAECARIFYGVSEPFSLGDDLLCDAQAGDMRVILSEGQVFVSEAVAGSGVVNCRGEVALKLLCCRDGAEGVPSPILRRIPFSQSVPLDGVEINCDATADGVCKELHVTVEEGRILCEVTALLTVRAQRNEQVDFVRDLYSTEAPCEVEYLACVCPRAIKAINGNFSIGTALPLSEAGIKNGATLVDFAMTPMLTGAEWEHGRYYLSGRARCQAVVSEGGELSAQEFELPFRYEAEGSADPVVDYNASIGLISCRARVDGERIGVDAELAVSLSTRSESRFGAVAQAKFGDAEARTGAVYTICYPAREDTLWSVAKRYRRPVDLIAEINALAGAPAADSPESLAGVRYLLV